MTTVGLQPASSVFARSNVEKTLRKPVRLVFLEKYLPPADSEKLKALFPDGLVRIWGVKTERVYQWAKLVPDDCLVLFRQGRSVVFLGIVAFRALNEPLALRLWDRDEGGDAWSLIYFLSHVKEVEIPVREVNIAAGLDPEWSWQGFITVVPPAAVAVLELVAKHKGV